MEVRENGVYQFKNLIGFIAFRQIAPGLLIIDWDLDNLNGLEFTKNPRG